MASVKIHEDQRYPCYDLGDAEGVTVGATVGITVELPDDELTRIRQVIVEWEAVQVRLKELYYRSDPEPPTAKDNTTDTDGRD